MYCQRHTPIQFLSDVSLTSLITTSENSFCSAVEKLEGWCKVNHLLLIVSKTEETVVDFGRAPPTPCPLAIYGEEVATVREYKYLGSIINAKSYWSPNALVFLKGNQQLYLMKQLKPFSICPKLLELFFNNLCHFSSLKDQDMAKLSMVTKTTSRQSGRPVLDLQAHFCKIQQIDQLLGQDELVPFISCCHCPQ